MGWLVDRHELRSKRIQRILGDIFLHAAYGTGFAAARLVFEPYQFIPEYIESVRLFRPNKSADPTFDRDREALEVVYDKHKGMNGMFYLESRPYNLRVEADSSIGPDALIVSSVLDKALHTWMRRWVDEVQARREAIRRTEAVSATGSAAIPKCVNCGAVPPATARFCSECGTGLTA